MGDAATFARLEPLGERRYALHDQPDAGLWEFRGRAEVHTYSSVMCWAACDRLAKIAVHLNLRDRSVQLLARSAPTTMHARITEHAYNTELGHFVEALDGNRLDASLLLLADLGFVKADDPRFVAHRRGDRQAACGAATRCSATSRPTTSAIRKPASPSAPSGTSTRWPRSAARTRRARLFERMLARRNPLGLLSEDLEFGDGEAWGNFPQTYSHVGLIIAAMRLSRGGPDVARIAAT